MMPRGFAELTREQRDLAKVLLADHQKKLVGSSFITCAACFIKKWAGVAGEEAQVRLFLPKKKLGQGRNVGTYVICNECAGKLSPKEEYERVDHYMASQGLYHYTA